MKFSRAATIAALATSASAAPKARQAGGACDAPVELDASTNVFQQYTLHANSFYRSEVEAAAEAARRADEAAEQAVQRAAEANAR